MEWNDWIGIISICSLVVGILSLFLTSCLYFQTAKALQCSIDRLFTYLESIYKEEKDVELINHSGELPTIAKDLAGKATITSRVKK